VDLALINTNYALEAKLAAQGRALHREDLPYANVLVARPDNQNSVALKKLDAALHSAETRQFIEQKYQGAVVPAF
jgi:D-methionine transport system substrate-binding protein